MNEVDTILLEMEILNHIDGLTDEELLNELVDCGAKIEKKFYDGRIIYGKRCYREQKKCEIIVFKQDDFLIKRGA